MFWPLQSHSKFSRVSKDSQVPFSGAWMVTSHFLQSEVVTEGPSLLFMWVRGRDLFFQMVFELWCGKCIVHCSFATWTVDSWFSIFLGLASGGWSNQRVPKFWPIPQKVPYSTYFYPICFDKCFPPFLYIGGPKGRNSILQNKTFYCL